jgi:hypothetical protein
LELLPLAGSARFARLLCLTSGELTMHGRERFLLVPLEIGEGDDVDVLVGVATKHRAHAGVNAFLLREHDVPGWWTTSGVKNALVD